MTQQGIAKFFGGKDIESTKKNAIVRKQVNVNISDFDNVFKDVEIPTVEGYNIPRDVVGYVAWNRGDPIPFTFITKMVDELEPLTGKLEINDLLCKYFLAILMTTPKDIVPFVFLCLGQLRPNHEGVKINIGQESIISALGDKKVVKEKLKKEGDLSKVAQQIRSTQKSMTSMFGKVNEAYTITGVYKEFLKMAGFQGANSDRNRTQTIQKLLTNCKPEEVKCIVRMLECKLRVGAAHESFLFALGMAFRRREYIMGMIKNNPDEEDLKDHGHLFREIYYRYPIIDEILVEFLRGSFKGAEKNINIKVGIPAMPMLAKPAKKLDEIKRRLGDGRITGEYKYDGERAQIHKNKEGKVRIFSRSAEDSTAKFADVADIITDNVKGEQYILDSEIVAYDPEKHVILPFQTLMNRPKKGTDTPSAIHVCVCAFDLLSYNGVSMLDEPLEKRRDKLHEIVTVVPTKLQLATYKNASKIEDLGDFFEEAVSNRTEGLMVKTLNGRYECGKRAMSWAKLKKDYISKEVFKGGVAEEIPPDTIDVVVIGATYGKGKRTSVYGAFLVGVYNNVTGKVESLCFVGTGFKEDDLKEFYEKLHPLEMEKCPDNVDCRPLDQDPVFFKPELVWEIQVADIQTTPTYSACWGELGEKGLTIRFGRYYRTRTDKTWEQSTSTEQLLELYHQQFEK
ncbi:hypothetical protein TVAG_162990 [Trichomonas vaginalis G3]|uniref:DNA ligase n=1 Tax=Trichomonas vaginalis (strain ATCC PRA-98 / G3) TaxID=412133 RepID=A2DFX6_TRIV3|nr:DNA ligase 1/3 family member family [Trichomonas vaginalis G3]EAY20603.1 hypothetical protein TVAG_162990 [Trichomonas vaginalis G3]KAI5487209.1 DNA ligase 1/3 family member family [Trichomonas vaginalis G3]|eukprot:XP_001581589.1 hypothetical protein [Trichomonas vaginalis G3]